MRQQKTNIDLLRFAATIAVVYIHTVSNYGAYYTGFLATVRHIIFLFANQVINPIEIFMIMTAFFLYKGVQGKEKQERHRVISRKQKQLVILYGFWSIPWLFFLIKDALGMEGIGEICLFFFRKVFLLGTHVTFWYMLAMIYAIPVVFYLYFRGKAGKVLCVLCVAATYFLTLAGDTYYYVFDDVEFLDRIVLFWRVGFDNMQLLRAPLLIFMGIFLAEREDGIVRLVREHRVKSGILAAAIFGITVVLRFIEVEVTYQNGWSLDGLSTLMGPFTGMALWGCVYFLLPEIIKNRDTKFLRHSCTTIYFTHALGISVLNKAGEILGVTVDPFLMMFCCLAIGFFASWLLQRLSQKKRLNWIRKVY